LRWSKDLEQQGIRDGIKHHKEDLILKKTEIEASKLLVAQL